MNISNDLLIPFYPEYLWGLIVVMSISLIGSVRVYKTLTEVCNSQNFNLFIFGIVFQLPLLGYLYIGHKTKVLYKILDYLF